MPSFAFLDQQDDDAAISTLAANLNQLMLSRGISTKELYLATGISIPAVNNLKRGIGNPTLSTLVSLAKYFDISIQKLISQSPKKDLDDIQQIPILNFLDTNLIENAKCDGYVTIDATEEIKQDKIFAVELSNNNMVPFFEKGSLFLISPNLKYHDGDLVLVSLSNKPPCFRRIFISDPSPLFKSIDFNSTPNAYKNFNILGVVIKVIQSWR